MNGSNLPKVGPDSGSLISLLKASILQVVLPRRAKPHLSHSTHRLVSFYGPNHTSIPNGGRMTSFSLQDSLRQGARCFHECESRLLLKEIAQRLIMGAARGMEDTGTFCLQSRTKE